MVEVRRQLLVIDDDTIVRKSIAAYLEDSGFDVTQFGVAKEGLAWLQSNHVDLVVTDLCMPELDGLSLLKLIKQQMPDIPVIVISGMGVVRDVVEALRHGAADYLVKPLVDMEVLVHAIGRGLERNILRAENQLYRDQLERANKELEEYVQLLERDQQAGRRVQSKLLPRAPKVCGPLHIDYQIIPSLYLSGDFIDYALQVDRYFAFYLTDVSGHGAAPAFVTVWLKQLVQRCFREQSIFRSEESFRRDAGTLLKLINREIIHAGIGCHMTCFVGVIDIHTLEMRYVVAGHLPLPVLVSGSRVEYLQGKGKPLGIFEDGDWPVSVVQLPQNFSLTIFSDGVLEVLPPPGLIEKEQYLLDSFVAESAPQIHTGTAEDRPNSLQKVNARLKLLNLDTAPDDIAILSISSASFRAAASTKLDLESTGEV
ncbi:response regulator [Teredinibacter waterburyi]|jgi:Response regulator containing CheY-like receiver, AAA-type ATPase, and DNA-binding domains|uniref:response regulator n=1 Tax=Teredinibacter waterburyi TaxID=1500538 RepID=UPI00165F9BE2|nr:response regulator [Teredinibacter waterburyi]